ncbi:tektin-3-like [Engraulis encrasicolus]|uniref:tektin-3-like n=1 Tax=Engraulis encrasicolus TaxID=184585 RepID=UPI002FD0CB69
MELVKSTQGFRPNTRPDIILPTLTATPTRDKKGDNPQTHCLLPLPPKPSTTSCMGRDRFRLRSPRTPALRPAMPMHSAITPQQWAWANAANYKRSDNNHRSADILRKDTSRLICSKDDFTNKTQNESNKWISERIDDLSFWSSEGKHESEKLLKDTDMLKKVKIRLDHAISETEGPLQVARECLGQRQKRMGADRVRDEVEIELMQEVTVIKACQEQLQTMRDRVNKQLESNRIVQLILEKDLNDKHVAFEIDTRCHKMTNCNSTLQSYNNLSNLDMCFSVPQSWAKFSEDNIVRSQTERVNTKKVMEEAEREMANTTTNMWNQFYIVNRAFNNRIAETTEARNCLQYHMAKTLQEIFQTEHTIADLERTINNKKIPLQVAKNRLEERTKRPNMELCKDPPHNMLLREVQHIQGTMSTLSQRLAEAEDMQQQLAATKSLLEQELFVKAHSLFIDQERCMGLRRTFPSHPRLVGYA